MLNFLISYRDLHQEISEKRDRGDDESEIEALYDSRTESIWNDTYDRFVETGAAAPLALDSLLSLNPAALQREPSALFHSSLLVSTVSMCEVFLGQVMRAFLRSKPEAISGSEVRFKFSDISQFDSIQSLRDHHVERQVEAVIRQGGIDDWMKWFEGKVNIYYPQVTGNALEVREIFQRRHIHVHNDGDVSDLYLAKMSDLPTPPSLGEYLVVDEEYLTGAVDRLRVFGIALVLVISRRLTKASKHPSLEELEEYGCDLAYGLLKAKKYAAVIELIKLLEEGTGQQNRRMRFQVNSWIARARLGDKKYRSEVEAWDTSALDPIYELAKVTLLGDLEPAHRMARDFIAAGSLSASAYHEWPLFESLREAFPLDDNDLPERPASDGQQIPDEGGPASAASGAEVPAQADFQSAQDASGQGVDRLGSSEQ